MKKARYRFRKNEKRSLDCSDLQTWPVLTASKAMRRERSAVDPPAPQVVSVKRGLVATFIRSILAKRFCLDILNQDNFVEISWLEKAFGQICSF